MKKIISAISVVLAVITIPAHATVEHFDSAASALSDGFALSRHVWFQDPGRPFLQVWNDTKTITATDAFTFKSLDFNFDPWNGANRGTESSLNMVLRDAGNNELLNTWITIPTNREWITYSNTIFNVSTVSFLSAGRFWPSFDNLKYERQVSEVPEPATAALAGLGLLGFLAARRRQTKSRNA